LELVSTQFAQPDPVAEAGEIIEHNPHRHLPLRGKGNREVQCTGSFTGSQYRRGVTGLTILGFSGEPHRRRLGVRGN
jgi:hypothetical protein